MRIAVVAPSSRFEDEDEVDRVERRVTAIARRRHPGTEIVFHRQCWRRAGHFAGTDAEREDALVAVANDSEFHAVWFARGGYGSNRIAERAIARFERGTASRKTWLGYSDAGFLLAGLHRHDYPNVAHGPMPKDAVAYDDDAPVERALDWLVTRSAQAREPHLVAGQSYLAFNITVFSMLLGTPLEPELAGHVLMLEDTSEYLYATDRAMFHITSSASVRRLAGIRLGRIAVKDNPGQPFGETVGQLFARWCGEAGIAYGNGAGIGHDSANMVVPFGRF